MRLDINLATQPYEDAREFWTRWGTALGALLLLTIVLVALAARGWINAGRDRANIRHLNQQVAERDHERAQAQTFLDLPANRSTRDQAQFLNGLIERRGFSWTRVFEDLERVLPAPLHVVSLQPTINDQGQLLLELTVASDSRAGALDLVHHLEASDHFQDSLLQEENVSSENGPGVTAKITSVYIPEPPGKSDSPNRSPK